MRNAGLIRSRAGINCPFPWFVIGVGKLLMGMLIVYTVVLAEVLLLYTRAGPRRGSVSANPG